MPYEDPKLSHSSSRNSRASSHAPINFSQLPFYDDTMTPTLEEMRQDPEYFRAKKHKEFKIVLMDPTYYLISSMKGFEGNGYTHDQTLFWNYEVTHNPKTQDYAQIMKQGGKFPMPWLEYDVRTKYNEDGTTTQYFFFQQEGRHRAAAAMLNKTPLIPVMIVYSTRNSNLIKPHMSLSVLKEVYQ